MIICHSRKFVFIHIHKCAGTSIEQALSEHMAPEDLQIGSVKVGEKDQDHYRATIGLTKHSTALEARAFLGAERWAQYYRFGMVRNPVDRLRSLYGFTRNVIDRNPLQPAEKEQFARNGQLPKRRPFTWKAVKAALRTSSFEEFAMDPLTWEDKGSHPQWKSLCDESGKLLVDFVGKVENIGTDWQTVCTRLGMTIPLAMKNTSGVHAVKQVAPQLQAELHKRYERDYEMFGYA